MLLRVLSIGKTSENYLKTGIDHYCGRLQHYISFEYTELPDIKSLKGRSEQEVKRMESDHLLAAIGPHAWVVLLDEKGKHWSSRDFATQLQKRFNAAPRELVFVIGGPYGFSDELYARANEKLSLSSMTFSHQMVRLFALEQLYRAMTILRNEPYHHD